MPNMEAGTVSRIFVQEVFARIDVPISILSDQGRQYEIELFFEMCHALHIKRTCTTPYHFQSDGMMERFNKTGDNAKCLRYKHHSDWERFLPCVMIA